MTTKTITSDKSETKVGTAGTKLYTSTRTTYNEDADGKIDPKSVKHEILYHEAPLSSGVVAATTTGTSQDWTLINKPLSNNPWLGADAQKSLKEGILKSTTQQQIQTAATKAKIPPEQQKSLSTKQINAATNSPNSENIQAINKEFKAGDREGTRNKYEDLHYPSGLKLNVQDVIKFSILKYVPSLSAKGQEEKTGRIVTLEDGNPIVRGSERISTIILPIPAGINDSNTVNWKSDSLNVLQEEGAKLAKALFEGGTDAAGKQLSKSTEKAGGPDAKTALSGLLMNVATQGNIQGRAYGAVNNNNLEVLFDGPGLRSFSFQFSFYPREPNEAIMVRKIIRTFKQSMSVKRSANSLLLKAPHTFAISYMTSKEGKSVAHPYLNRFKECALTSCNIDYTPDGTYMTYGGDEKSMTTYRMTLSFSELEPIFDDEYGKSDYDNVGF